MPLGKSNLQWPAKIGTSAAFFFVGAAVGTGLYFATYGLYFETGKSNGLYFEKDTSHSVGLDGDLRPPSANNHGAQITLHDLQDKIAAENKKISIANEPHVTILYAGMLTAAQGNEQSAVSSIRQLAGAYLAQIRNNHRDQPGEVGNPLKVRLLPVNVGQNMDFSVDAAGLMLAMARRDSTIVGVVGMERNTDTSRKAIQMLNDAGLPVIDTANSSDVLPTLQHYYGIVSTDHDEAVAAKYAADHAPKSGPIHGLIVSRDASGDPGRSRDLYSEEQATDVRHEFAGRYDLSLMSYHGNDDISGEIRTACRRTQYNLVYFAGRAEDLPGLLYGLNAGGCTKKPLTLIGGDEVARITFGSGKHQVPLPPDVTVYYTIFTYLPNLSPTSGNSFVILTQHVLHGPLPTLSDGQTAVAYDATSALAEAAQAVYIVVNPAQSGGQTVTSAGVLLTLQNLRFHGVTGTIDFSMDEHRVNGAGNRGLTLMKVTVSKSMPKYEPVCGRMNGGGQVPGLRPCEG